VAQLSKLGGLRILMSPELRNITAICLFICLLGVGFAGWGVFDLWQTRVFVASAERTTGKVVAFEWGLGRRGSVSYPVYEFTNRSGQTHRATSTISGSSDANAVGSGILVLYHPQDPNISRIGEFAYLYTLPLAFAGLGGLAILVSVGAFFSGYKSYKS
jgi:hypothetical protein